MSAKPQFFEIKDVGIVGKIFDLANRHGVQMTVWLKDQNMRFDTRVIQFIEPLNRLVIQIPNSLSGGQVESAFTKQGSSDIMGSFTLESVNFFFKTNFLEVNEKGFQIARPPSVFKMQRRSNLRISFSRHLAPKLTIFDPRKKLDPNKPIADSDILSFRVLDVSVGGVGFAAKIEDSAVLKKGAKIEDLRFKLKDAEIVATGVIRHTLETISDKKEPMLKVGVEFSALKPKYESAVAQFVLEESRKMFSAFF